MKGSMGSEQIDQYVIDPFILFIFKIMRRCNKVVLSVATMSLNIQLCEKETLC